MGIFHFSCSVSLAKCETHLYTNRMVLSNEQNSKKPISSASHRHPRKIRGWWKSIFYVMGTMGSFHFPCFVSLAKCFRQPRKMRGWWKSIFYVKGTMGFFTFRASSASHFARLIYTKIVHSKEQSSKKQISSASQNVRLTKNLARLYTSTSFWEKNAVRRYILSLL